MAFTGKSEANIMILQSELVKGVFGTDQSPSLVSLIKLNSFHFPHLQNRTDDTDLTGLL